ncbi:hypothetical protein [uncultured Rhodoblastus sp.]|uniref:hypothetical protein n=1 Tax=uncultured Rhodoblastus sp. TaxID=543037 RepID=UPI0025E09D98|nr:hypothetical protein [uncultured Rhodoblastus sp.]
MDKHACNIEHSNIIDRSCIYTEFPLLVTSFPYAAMEGLISSLWLDKTSRNEAEWKLFCAEFPRRHQAIHHLLQKDVFTEHSYRRPRGYAGDADLIDIIYDMNPAGSEGVGKSIFSYLIRTRAPQAVRERRKIASDFISKTIQSRRESARICSIASGHARELEPIFNSPTSNGCNTFQFDAHDQDNKSLLKILKKFGNVNIQTRQQSVVEWIKGRSLNEKYDLIYSLGLFDYLEKRVAIALVRSAWKSVAPNGKLVIANFIGNFIDIAYMEACMNWWLIYRTSDEMEALLKEVNRNEIDKINIFKDSLSMVTYVEIIKRDTCEL